MSRPALDDLVAVDEALTRLETIDPRKAKIVTLRYFAGLSVEETAKALDLSPATIKNEWAFARAWLSASVGHQVSRQPAGGREHQRLDSRRRKYFSPLADLTMRATGVRSTRRRGGDESGIEPRRSDREDRCRRP